MLDYDLEYDEGIPDTSKFPEYNNKLWRFFSADSSMCTGFFKFGDLESGATMHLKVAIYDIFSSKQCQLKEDTDIKLESLTTSMI